MTGSYDDGSRLIAPDETEDDRYAEGALRPESLQEFIGQARVREQLELVLEGARRRGDPPDHILLSGPPGLGQPDGPRSQASRSARRRCDDFHASRGSLVPRVL